MSADIGSVSAVSSTALLGRMRLLEKDHESDGWPAVRMCDISTLCDEIERLRSALHEIATYPLPEARALMRKAREALTPNANIEPPL